VYRIGTFDPDSFGRSANLRFSVLGTYAATKLMVLMFTEELARRLKSTSVTANAVHPGVVRTQMMLRAPGVLRLMAYLSLPFSVSPEVGARTSVYLASDPEVSGVSGRYFVKSRPAAVKNKADTPANRVLLWDLSEDATRARVAMQTAAS
jgi:retinol dehydrogenase-12